MDNSCVLFSGNTTPIEKGGPKDAGLWQNLFVYVLYLKILSKRNSYFCIKKN